AGDRVDQRGARDPLTVLRLLNPRALRALRRAFLLGCARTRGERRGLVWQPERGSGVWQPGHARKKFSASRRPPRVIHRTGNRGARAFAAGGAWGARHPSCASARAAAALAAPDRARISTQPAAPPPLRPRASTRAPTLASPASPAQ